MSMSSGRVISSVSNACGEVHGAGTPTQRAVFAQDLREHTAFDFGSGKPSSSAIVAPRRIRERDRACARLDAVTAGEKMPSSSGSVLG